MDESHIQSPRSNPLELYEDIFDISFMNQRNDHTNRRQQRFSQIFQLSPFNKKQEIQLKKFSPEKDSPAGHLYGRLSPLSKRYQRRPIFEDDDYQKYLGKLQIKEQNHAFKPQKVNSKDGFAQICRNESSSLQVKNDQEYYDVQNKIQRNELQQKVSILHGNYSKKGSNYERKRLPQIIQEKAVFKKMGTLQIKSKKQKDSQIEKNQKQNDQRSFNQKPQKYSQERREINKKQVICFHCGGHHYANQCIEKNSNSNSLSFSNSGLRCYNCKQQGHISTFCVQKKRCMICQSSQHLAKNCPLNQSTKNQSREKISTFNFVHQQNQQVKKSQCFYCHGQGHWKKDCPKLKNSFQNRQFNTKQKTCFNCKKTGHYANQCKEPIICHNCGLSGHYARNCTNIRQSNQPQNNKDIQSMKINSQNLNNFNFKRR